MDSPPSTADFARVPRYAANPYLALGGPDVAIDLQEDDDALYEGEYPAQFATYAAWKFATAAVASPFEVARVLLQVQYRPSYAEGSQLEPKMDTDASSARADESEEREYGQATDTFDQDADIMKRSSSVLVETGAAKTLDTEGYLVYEQGDRSTRPSYMLPSLKDGIWRTIRTVASHPSGGYLTLFKGHFTNWFHVVVGEMIEPSVESTVCDVLKLDDSLMPVDHDNPLPIALAYTAVQVAVGVFLSPFEIVRTRLIVQATTENRRYYGFLHAMRSLFSDSEPNPYTGRHLVVPSLCYHILRATFNIFTPLIIDRAMGFSKIYHPLQYAVAEFFFTAAHLAVISPVDTARKRLQCQPGAAGRTWTPSVDISPMPYLGLRDCITRIIEEEGAPAPSRRQPANRSPLDKLRRRLLRFRGLYQGFGMEMTNSATLLALRIITVMLDVEVDDAF
ncbi:hypothetical protein RI367_006820 [Sorochytrium milnesiophthora]